jgi:hypothetical protein
MSKLDHMSVTEIKAQADGLPFDELSDLARYLRKLVLGRDPRRQTQVLVAQKSADWLTEAEFAKALADLDEAGR